MGGVYIAENQGSMQSPSPIIRGMDFAYFIDIEMLTLHGILGVETWLSVVH